MGLILPRNPLAYPGGWARPGVDPAHVAITQATGAKTPVRFSGVATQNGFIRLDKADVATVSGVTSHIDPVIGPAPIFPTNGYIAFPNVTGVASPVGLTFAGIFARWTSSSYFIVMLGVLGTNSTTPDGLCEWSGFLQPWNNGNLGAANVQPLVAGNPVFVAASYIPGTSSVSNIVARDLITGGIVKATLTKNVAVQSTNGVFIGNLGGQGWGANQTIAAAAVLNTYVPLPQLLAWAQAPWDFWYPPTALQMVFAGIGKSAPANTGTLAITEVADTFAFSGNDANSGTLVVTESADTFLFAGSDTLTGTLVVTEAADTFSFVGGSQVNRGTLTVLEAADTFAFGGPQPQAQAGPLRERTYRRRFIGYGFETTGNCIITKDRPGPLRIIEFIGETKEG